ncbi:agamous-like MADS-box protein AGL11 isoform X3 [Raphanus sativus]|uniref:Agamous-like MADS-box protein AGL11 isoform X3 n=1 Tax=Raphanus sativus TaxID=3726 RepID=A0A9W3C855_RAPSA|nr:agamous-like MADS-box protein AGL11 isoform X3 [Raphanus sativus]
MGDSLSALNVKELKQVENRLEKAISRIRSKKHELLLAEIESLQKTEIELDNESIYLRTKKWRGFNNTIIKWLVVRR